MNFSTRIILLFIYTLSFVILFSNCKGEQNNNSSKSYSQVISDSKQDTTKKTRTAKSRFEILEKSKKESLFKSRSKKYRQRKKPSKSRKEKKTYSSFAEVPADILLSAMVKDDFAEGFKFTISGREKIGDFKFGDVFSVLPRTDPFVSVALDSLIRGVPLMTEDGKSVWIQTDKLLLRRQAYIPAEGSVSFYKKADDIETKFTFSFDDVAAQVVLYFDQFSYSSENVRILTNSTYITENQPGKWGNYVWVSDTSLVLWLDEIRSKAAERFIGWGGVGDWEYTPNYDRSYWKQQKIKRGTTLSKILIDKYKPIINEPLTAKRHIKKYSKWHNVFARLFILESDKSEYYSILDSFAIEAESYAKTATDEFSNKWSVAAAKARDEIIKTALRYDIELALKQASNNIEYHADLPMVGYEVRNTFGVIAMVRLRYNSYAVGLSEADIAEFSKSVPSLTNSPAVNAIALLVRAEIAEKKMQFLKADSLHLKTAELYPLADGRYYQSYVNWAHTALHRWMIAPILRDANYDASLKRLSVLNDNYNDEFSELISFINCDMNLIIGNKSDKNYNECLTNANIRNYSANAHVAEFNSLIRSFPINGAIRPHPLPRRRNNNPTANWYITAPEDLSLYKYPYVSTDIMIANGEKAQLLLRSIEGYFPDKWIKIQMSDSTTGWIKSDGIREYLE